MTKAEFDAKWDSLGARERDAWVDSKVFGRLVSPPGSVAAEWVSPRNEAVGGKPMVVFSPVPHYTTEIGAAWAVLDAACSWLFSKRGAFFEHLQERTKGFAWPHALALLRHDFPEAICKAALMVAEGVES